MNSRDPQQLLIASPFHLEYRMDRDDLVLKGIDSNRSDQPIEICFDPQSMHALVTLLAQVIHRMDEPLKQDDSSTAVVPD